MVGMLINKEKNQDGREIYVPLDVIDLPAGKLIFTIINYTLDRMLLS